MIEIEPAAGNLSPKVSQCQAMTVIEELPDRGGLRGITDYIRYECLELHGFRQAVRARCGWPTGISIVSPREDLPWADDGI